MSKKLTLQGGERIPSKTRSVWVSLSFSLMFLAITILAWTTAGETGSPWFGPEVSALFYGVTLLGGSIVGFGVAASASLRATHLDSLLRAVEREIASVGGPSRSEIEVPEPGASADDPVSLGDILGGLENIVAEGPATIGPVGPAPPIQLETGVSPPDARVSEKRRVLLDERELLRSARSRIWLHAGGPMGLATLFVAVSSTMLPGTESFLVQNFRLNTMLILMIAYSWWILLAWAVVTLATLPSESLDSTVPSPQ